MAVTEFAFVYLSSPLTSEAHQALEDAQRIQDKWAQAQDSGLPSDRTARGTGMLQQIDDPSAILITARWTSPEAHWKWIGTEENKQAMGKLMPLIVTEGERKLVLFHVDSVLFPTPQDAITSALASPIVSVYHCRVRASSKGKFESVLEEVMGKLNTDAGTLYRWGWKIEKESDEIEELLMVRGRDSDVQRLEEEHVVLETLSASAVDVKVRSYKRIV